MTSENASIDIDRRLLTAAARDQGLRLVVLYGSYARRDAGPESDIDIAVLGCPAERFWACYEALSEVFSHFMLDLVRLEDADPLFRQEIMRGGKLLYGDQDLFCEFRAFAFRDFIDSAGLFALEDALFRKKMARMKEQLYGSP